MVSDTDSPGPRILPRSLAGATILQIVPTLRDSLLGRTAVDTARALVHAGARAIVAGEPGDLVDELKGFGGEWLSLSTPSLNPLRLRSNARALDEFMAAEGVHIVHARNPGAVRAVRAATQRQGIRLVTELPALPRARMRLAALYLGALSRGDRVISHSMYNARPMIARHRIAAERIGIVPGSVDVEQFDPANVRVERIAALRHSWGIPTGMHILMVPGRLAPWNGHLVLIEAARILADNGIRNVTFILVGNDRRRRFVRKFWKRAQSKGVDTLFRVIGHFQDMPLAYAAADFVVVPYIAPPAHGRMVAEAQAMARPAIISSVGPLPENILAPPHVAEEMRTGWEVEPGDPSALADAIADAIALDDDAYQAQALRAREFAEHRFSPGYASAATLEIYASLLETED